MSLTTVHGSILPIDKIQNPDGYKLIGEVDSIQTLRTISPTSDKQKIKLKGYYVNSYVGGGDFISIAGTAQDDNGTIIVPNNSTQWYWKRIGDPLTFDITMFGAIPDGQTLIDTAFISMFKWAYGTTAESNIDTILTSAQRHIGCVKFPQGIFAIGNIDLTSFGRKMAVKIIGDVQSDYKSIGTTLVLKGNSGGYALTASFLQVEISGFNIYGSWNVDQNTCGFFNNVYASAPQQCRFRSFAIQHVGGIIFNLVDTMDTELTQCYMNNGQSTLIYNKWSGNPIGAWDHTTAVALRDISVWNTKNKPVFFMPRCHQVQISNVWVSGCDHPGNFAQGSATTDQFNIEDNKKALQAQNWRVIHSFLNVQGSFGIDYNSGYNEIPSDWDNNSMGVPSYVTQPQWEGGRSEITNHGFYSDFGHVIENFRASRKFIKNAGATQSWFKIGSVYMNQLGQQCRFKIIGCGGYNAASGILTHSYDTGFGGGVTYIDIQNKGNVNKSNVTWYSENSPAITGVKYVPVSTNTTDIYVKVNTYTPVVAVYCETSANSRIDSGLHFLFTWDGSLISDINTIVGSLDAKSRWMVGNSKDINGGFGMDFDNGSLVIGTNLSDVTLTGTCSINVAGTVYNGTTSMTRKGIPIYVNGALYYLIAGQ